MFHRCRWPFLDTFRWSSGIEDSQGTICLGNMFGQGTGMTHRFTHRFQPAQSRRDSQVWEHGWEPILDRTSKSTKQQEMPPLSREICNVYRSSGVALSQTSKCMTMNVHRKRSGLQIVFKKTAIASNDGKPVQQGHDVLAYIQRYHKRKADMKSSGASTSSILLAHRSNGARRLKIMVA